MCVCLWRYTGVHKLHVQVTVVTHHHAVVAGRKSKLITDFLRKEDFECGKCASDHHISARFAIFAAVSSNYGTGMLATWPLVATTTADDDDDEEEHGDLEKNIIHSHYGAHI